MDEVNPYAAPRHHLSLNAAEPGCGIWRDGNLLVMRNGAVLPDRCIKCNSPSEGDRVKVTVLYLSPLLRPQAAKIAVALCNRDRAKWKRAVNAIFTRNYPIIALGFAAIGVWRLAGATDSLFRGLMLALFVVSFALLIFWGTMKNLIVMRKAYEDYFWLKGFGPDYLAQFPPFPG